MIMKTFHSSGTPIGRLLMMLRWKQIITTAATLVTIPPSPSRRSNGTPNSTTVPPCASAAEMRAGPQVVGEAPVEAPLDVAEPPHRAVAHHRGDHVGEVPVELGGRGTPPDRHHHQLGGHDRVAGGEQVGDRQRAVDLRAGRQEDHLVAQRDHEPARRAPRRPASAAPRRTPPPRARRAARRTARRRRRSASRRRSAAPDPATARAGSSRAAASRGTSPAGA